MNINARTHEIMRGIRSFSKETYCKHEVLPELFALQDELVEYVFPEEKREIQRLKIYDIEDELDIRNRSLGNPANDELEEFHKDCKDFCNMIRKEVSGGRGEQMAFQSLERLKGEHIILKNVELTESDARTEIDAVVITCKGVYIVEVKNTKRDIFIDEQGDYYRTGEYLRWDSNIKSKLETKEQLLRHVLEMHGIEGVPLRQVVVFTDNRIHVKNRCKAIQTCFLSQLPYIIGELLGVCEYNSEMIKMMAKTIDDARSYESYPMKVDIQKMKLDFAKVMAEFENASIKMERRKRWRWFNDFKFHKITPFGVSHAAAAVFPVLISCLKAK